MTYEQGFTAGEHQAWLDRKAGVLEKYRPDDGDPWTQGFWDAYIPRTKEWAGNAWKKNEVDA